MDQQRAADDDKRPYTICLRLQYSDSIGAVSESMLGQLLNKLRTCTVSRESITFPLHYMYPR